MEHGPGAVGVALAESHPALVHVLHLEGGTDACRLLLERLVRMAGERDVSVWFPTPPPSGNGDVRPERTRHLSEEPL